MIKMPKWKEKGIIIDVALKSRLPAKLPSDIDILKIDSKKHTFTELEELLTTLNGSYKELYVCDATPVYVAVILGLIAYNSEVNLINTDLEARVFYLFYDNTDNTWVEVDI